LEIENLLTDYHQALHLWHKTPLGQGVWHAVCKEVASVTSDFFGQRVLIVGMLDMGEWLARCPITERVYLANTPADHHASVCADVHSLPFADDSIDAIIVPYAFEWLLQLDGVVAELSRVLIPQGNMLIVGFNPVSLWGLMHPWQKDKLPPFHGRLLRMGHIRHLLAQANCVVDEMQTCYYGLPSTHASPDYGQIIETLGRLGWPSWGSVYMIHAHKQVTPLIPIRPRWPQKVKWDDEPAWIKPT
jgi:SAM-dependent methyltransferase